ncbi:MAG: hypothetical protein ACAH07_05945 [Methylophilaceae bacterium]|nr:hypothetical protein [Methyloradius sp.]
MIDQLEGNHNRRISKAEDPHEPQLLRNLWVAVIQQAIFDIKGFKRLPGGRLPKFRKSNTIGTVSTAYTWLFNGKPGPTSFESLCLLLDMDAGRIRTEVIKNLDEGVFEEISQYG